MIDAPTRAERLLNVLALLLDTRRPLTQEEIVGAVSGYPPSRGAQRRAFERDKETLRAIGVPISVEAVDAEGGRAGYRVRPDDYFLPDLGLTADETAALRVAVTAVSLGQPAGAGALMKLGEVAPGGDDPLASLPLLPVLAPLFDAFRRRASVRFEYRSRTREVEPWGIVSRQGRWYLVGFDRDRGSLRTFSVERIRGEVEAGAAGAFEVPSDFRAAREVEGRPWRFGDGEPEVVRVALDPGHANALVEAAGDDAAWAEAPDGRTVVTLPVTDRAAFVSYVLGFLEHAEVLGPPAVRAEVVNRLERLAEPIGDGGARPGAGDP